jgi:hypothetical protein
MLGVLQELAGRTVFARRERPTQALDSGRVIKTCDACRGRTDNYPGVAAFAIDPGCSNRRNLRVARCRSVLYFGPAMSIGSPSPPTATQTGRRPTHAGAGSVEKRACGEQLVIDGAVVEFFVRNDYFERGRRHNLPLDQCLGKRVLHVFLQRASQGAGAV